MVIEIETVCQKDNEPYSFIHYTFENQMLLGKSKDNHPPAMRSRHEGCIDWESEAGDGDRHFWKLCSGCIETEF